MMCVRIGPKTPVDHPASELHGGLGDLIGHRAGAWIVPVNSCGQD
jgi:hypothetical protein